MFSLGLVRSSLVGRSYRRWDRGGTTGGRHDAGPASLPMRRLLGETPQGVEILDFSPYAIDAKCTTCPAANSSIKQRTAVVLLRCSEMSSAPSRAARAGSV